MMTHLEIPDQYYEAIIRVQLYIQNHLDEDLSLNTLASEACFSPFHFHRIFRFLAGERVGEYVRRLRLEKAALRLVNTRDPVICIALDAGYETPSALTRAFRKVFGKSPTEFRKERGLHTGAVIHPIQAREVVIMEPEIVTLPEREVIFVRRTGCYKEAAEQAWSAICSFAYPNKLMTKETQAIGISHDDPKITEAEKLRYDACLTVDRPVELKGEVGIQKIAGGVSS